MARGKSSSKPRKTGKDAEGTSDVATAAASASEREAQAPGPAAAPNARSPALVKADANPNGKVASESTANGSSVRTWDQCRPEVIKDTETGKRVIRASELWCKGQAKLRAGDETCIDDFGKAIHLDILGASFFAELVPRNNDSLGDKLVEYLRRAIDNKDTARQGKDLVYPLITRAYITFLLTATPQLRGLLDAKEGARTVRVSADLAVATDPDDPRLRIIRAGFLSQLGGSRSASTVAVDGRKAADIANTQIKAIEEDANSYVGGVAGTGAEGEVKPNGTSKGAGRKQKKTSDKNEATGKLTLEAAEKIAWYRLQRAHANLQLGDLHWTSRKSKDDRLLAENYLKAYVKDSTECDPDMHSACYKLTILSIWNLPNPKKVNIAPNLVRANPDKIQPALAWYKRGIAAQIVHHTWLPAGMDEQSGPTARAWLKVISGSLSQEPAVKPHPLIPHPGVTCENLECPNKGETPPGMNSGMCGSCHWANYCCRACQVAHWKEHKKTACKEAHGITVITADGDFLKQSISGPDDDRPR